MRVDGAVQRRLGQERHWQGYQAWSSERLNGRGFDQVCVALLTHDDERVEDGVLDLVPPGPEGLGGVRVAEDLLAEVPGEGGHPPHLRRLHYKWEYNM